VNTKEAYQRLAEMSAHPNSERLLGVLANAMTPEEAAFLLELPAANDHLAARFSLDEKAVEKKMDELMRRGLIVPSRKGARFPINLGFLHEAMLSSAPELIPPELPRLWKAFYESEWRQEIAELLGALEMPTLRVVPAQKAVPPGVELLPWENTRCIIEAARSRAVRNCACRVMVKGCDSPLHNCLQFNRRADYALGRGSGRPMSVDQVLEISLSSEDAGLVPMVGNIGILDRMDYICYCCNCCCTGLDPLRRVGKLTAGYAKSRFLASVDQQACTGCEICLERCHFDAIEMRNGPDPKDLKAAIDAEKCFGCGLCAIQCPPEAITLKGVRPPDHIPSTNVTVIP